jgi:hypothetical protein
MPEWAQKHALRLLEKQLSTTSSAWRGNSSELVFGFEMKTGLHRGGFSIAASEGIKLNTLEHTSTWAQQGRMRSQRVRGMAKKLLGVCTWTRSGSVKF